jgi:hypothetical protein
VRSTAGSWGEKQEQASGAKVEELQRHLAGFSVAKDTHLQELCKIS